MLYLTHHMLQESTRRAPSHEALVDNQERLDFEAAANRAARLGGNLQSAGVKRGDRIAIFLPPTVNLPLAILGVSMSGGVFVPIHHSLFPDQVAHIISDSGAVALITDGKRFDSLHQVISESTTLRFAVVNEPVESSDMEVVAGQLEVYDFRAMCNGTGTPCRQECIEKDLAAILYTSGSTGRPKGVMLSHANVLAGARIVASYLSITNRDRLLAALPLSFDAGLNQLTTAMLTGATTVMIDFRFGRDIVQGLIKERITGLAGVPPLWSLLAQPSSGLGKQPMPDLRYITSTGGAMPQNILAQLRVLLSSTEVFLMYGLTEAFRSSYLPPAELDRRPTSIGKAIPNTELLVVNEAGELCGPGEVGELVHHGPTVSLGYWQQPELTRRVLRPHPFPEPGRTNQELVCYSGDLVKMDQDGFLYFVGRRDDQIKSAGFRISPNEVEDVICKVAAIHQAAVIGTPDPVLGQHLIAFAISEEGAENLDPADILASCSRELPRHMIPKRIILVDQLPKTSSGKVNYSHLRNDYVAELEVNSQTQSTNQEPIAINFSRPVLLTSPPSTNDNASNSDSRPSIDQLARVIDECFDVNDHELWIGGIAVSELIDEFGSPLFIYDAGVIAKTIKEVRSVLPARFQLYYSIKANPNAAILKCMLQAACGLEVASAGELYQSLQAGCSTEQLIFAGPGKLEDELVAAVDASIHEIHVESIEEARTINTIAAARNRIVTISLRVNPIDASGGAMRMGGKPSPFGIDEEGLDSVIDELLQLTHLNIQGVHLFMGTQILDADVLIEQYRRAVSIAQRVASHLGRPLRTIDFGGGWGTPLFSHETKLDLSAVASGLASIDAEIAADPLLSNASAILEPGRFLVNECGVYVSKVTRVKHSRGNTFAVIDGGMHHHLAASGNLGQAIKRNFPLAILNKLRMPAATSVEVVGPLCTPLDTIGRSVKLPTIAAQDLIGVFLSGAYARTASPLGFLSHNSPAEVLVESGTASLIRRRGTADDYLRDQVN